MEYPKRLWAIETRPGDWSYSGLEATAKDCNLRGLVVIEYVPKQSGGEAEAGCERATALPHASQSGVSCESQA